MIQMQEESPRRGWQLNRGVQLACHGRRHLLSIILDAEKNHPEGDGNKRMKGINALKISSSTMIQKRLPKRGW